MSPPIVSKLYVGSVCSLLIQLILDLRVKIDGTRVAHKLLLDHSHLSWLLYRFLFQLSDNTLNLHLMQLG